MLSHTPVHSLSQNQRVIRLSLWYTPIAILVLVSVTAFHYLFYVSSESSRRNEIELLNLEVGRTSIASEISNIQSDVNFLARQAELHGYFDGLETTSLGIMARDFALFANEKFVYDQIRLIDREGQEIIRVNYQDGQSTIVEKSLLQNKAARYYFAESMQLQRNEMYMSPLDLNVEHEKIQIPFKPVMRFGTPVFDLSGNKIGVLILNYLGNRLLDNFRTATANIAEHIMILNHEGYWLSHFNRDLEWGFMLNHENSFANIFNNEWKTISTSQSGQFETDKGYFSYITIYPGLETSNTSNNLDASQIRPEFYNRPWSLVSHITSTELNQLLATFFDNNRLLYLLLFFIFIATTQVIAHLRARHQMAEVELEFEQHFRNVLESTELKVLAIDINGSITFCNDSLLSLLGWKRAQLIGQNWLGALVVDRCRAECRELFEQAMHQDIAPNVHEFWVQDRTGNEYLVRWNGSCLKDSAGELMGLTLMGEDITHEHEK